jgi:membrane associated rhomboid family serine protease
VKGLFEHADEIPVTLLLAIAYVTMAFLTDPFRPTAAALESWGWLTPMQVAGGEPWRLLTHAFLHGSILHLAFNLMFLMAIGPSLERTMGSVRFAVLYVVAAVGGGIACCLLYDPRSAMLGGSGALFGMMGSLVAWNMRAGRHLFAFLDFEGPRRLLALIGVNLAIGLFIPFVSNTGHVGGLVAGFGVTFLALAPAREHTAVRRQWQIATLLLFASLLFASVMPVTRWDWLWNRSVETGDAGRRAALQRAAAMSYYGEQTATDARVHDLYVEEIDPPLPGETRRGV